MIPSMNPSVVSAAAIAISIALNINIIHSFQLSPTTPNNKCTDPSSSVLSSIRRAITTARSHRTVLHSKKPRTANIVEMSKLLQQQSQSTIGQHSQKEERKYKKKTDDWLQLDLERELNNIATPSTTNLLYKSKKKKEKNGTIARREAPIKIIFSDIVGSLVHYDKTYDDQQQQENGDNELIFLPPSATGLRGVISYQTLSICEKLRIEKNVKLVLVTGARTSTLLNRLPYLPRADVYVSEGGGRIFYPTNVDSCCVNGEEEEFVYTPVDYKGAQELSSFGLVEDMVWRERMISGGVGSESYGGNEILSKRCNGSTSEDYEECIIDYDATAGFPIDTIPIEQRSGILWEYANHLIEKEGFVLDTKSYSTMFRVNRRHQVNNDIDKKFDDLLDETISHPKKIGMSTNLGCIDFFPVVSGKQNCCQYIANNFGHSLSKESVCICDDDNDIEMAKACSHSYIPSLTSKTMVDTLMRHGSNFTQTFSDDISSTAATEVALNKIYESS